VTNSRKRVEAHPTHERTRSTAHVHLVRPAAEHLSSYADALRRGWSPDSQRPEAAYEELLRLEADPAAFLALQDDREAEGPPITLPDGTDVPRLPGFHLWMWDGEFSGEISLRWQRGTTALPPTCLGHVGYGVVPWKRMRGYATRALGLMLPLARDEGLPFVELTTEEGNIASQAVIEANGGVLHERFRKPWARDGAPSRRYRIQLGSGA
jgi:predicted acetyltransferase